MTKDKQLQPELDIASEFPPNDWNLWKLAVEETLKGASYEKVMITKTYEGIDLKPIYRKEDIDNLPFSDSLPGQFPFIRGSKAEGNTLTGWIVAQTQSYWNAKETNRILKDELNRGLNAVNIKLDKYTKWALLPVNESYKPDGVCLYCLNDLENLLEGIHLYNVPIFIESGEILVIICGMISAYLLKTNQNPNDISGFMGFDLIAELLKDGELPFENSDIWHQIFQTTDWSVKNAPNLRTILMNGVFWANNGANAIQELTYAISSGNECIKALLDKGMKIEDLATRFQLNLSLGSNIFMEIAKIRAARLIWSELLKAYSSPENSCNIWIHGVTTDYNKTIYDPYVNILRTSTESFSGVIGGIDSLDIVPFDSRLKDPDEFSRRIARNQQLILMEEAHLNKVVDPSGGCYYIEYLTLQIAQTVWQNLQNIERSGGLYSLIESKAIHNDIRNISDQKILNACSRRDVFVGINMYANPSEQPITETGKGCHCDIKSYFESIDYIKRIDNDELHTILRKIADDKYSSQLIDYISEAFLLGATTEEISDVLFTIKDNLKADKLEPTHATKLIEDLRKDIVTYQQINKIVLSVFLANIGPISQHKARADFAQGFLLPGGFYVECSEGFISLQLAIESVLLSQSQAVCICSTDETYPDIVPKLIAGIREKKPDMIFILAGYPQDSIDYYKALGIDIFIHLRANLVSTLTELAVKMGVYK